MDRLSESLPNNAYYGQQQQQEPAVPAGMYSSTGFDMISILVRLTQRVNPQIQLGPIDLSCSFVVSDANKYDQPVVYCSPAFERLTGYTNNEIVGKNCRFLQSPDGQVTCGSKRQHTDNEAVFYLKSQLNQGKEHQASIINYRKGGQPFVNLVTIIPLFDVFGKIEYYVGLQVDLVEQPNAILEKMQNGTYVMNYSQPAKLVDYPSLRSQNGNVSLHDFLDAYFQELPNGRNIDNVTTSTNPNATVEQQHIPEILNLLSPSPSLNTLENHKSVQKEWNQLVLEQSSDFIHVLSLKGVFLYASSACLPVLEYQPSELLNQSLSTICHPSDIIPVMREIKESTAIPDQNISLLYRVRRKYSGYAWMECFGKVHMDQSRSRKCLVLSGRRIPVYALPKNEMSLQHSRYVRSSTIKNFWAKLSLGGLYLYVTKGCEEVVGYSPSSLEQESIFQYIDTSEITDMRKALELVRYSTSNNNNNNNNSNHNAGQQPQLQQVVRVAHTFLTAKGSYASVISTFYPGDTFSCQELDSASFILLHMQLSNEDMPATSVDRSLPSGEKLEVIAYHPTGGLNSNAILGQANLFGELETTRGTSWQYELHQLQHTNERLKDKIAKYDKSAAVIAVNQRKRKKAVTKAKDNSKTEPKRICAHCQTTESPEWRRGPAGPKELCNACGLRYAKSLATRDKKHYGIRDC